MKTTTSVKNRGFFIGALTCGLLLTGCDWSTPLDVEEEKEQHIQKGIEQAELRHWDEAIRHFENSLEQNRELARADLELALIYHQQKKDYTRAIYHYEQYLQKRANSEKLDLILGWIGQAKISFAAQIGKTTGSISKELVRLTRENNLLRKQLEKTAAPIVKPTPPKPKVVKPAPKPTPQPTPVTKKPIQRIQTPAPKVETYKVLPGDTLSRIAKAIYGDSRKWKEIYGANLDKMSNENDLKAGQIINIPKQLAE